MLLSFDDEKDPPEETPADDSGDPDEETEDQDEEEEEEPDEGEPDPARLKEQNQRLREQLNREKSEAGQRLATLTAENKAYREAQERLIAHGARRTTDSTDEEAAASAAAAFADLRRSTDPRDKAVMLIAQEVVKFQQQQAALNKRLDEVPIRASLKEDEREEVEAISKEHGVTLVAARLIRKGMKAEQAEKDRIKRQRELDGEDKEAPSRQRRTVQRSRSGRDVAVREMTPDQFARTYEKASDKERKELVAAQASGKLKIPI